MIGGSPSAHYVLAQTSALDRLTTCSGLCSAGQEWTQSLPSIALSSILSTGSRYASWIVLCPAFPESLDCQQ